MATADELGRSAWDEVHRLREVWAELYTPDGPDGELSNGRLSEDMDHSPVGLRHFVSALVGETCSTIGISPRRAGIGRERTGCGRSGRDNAAIDAASI